MAPTQFNWSRIKTHKHAFSVVVSTFGGLGLAPYAQGTFGTLGAVPFVVLFQTHGSNPWGVTIFWIALFALGTWAAREFDLLMKSHDSGAIVIDEVIGYAIASATCSGDPIALFVAFILFRIFDILKPPPCRQIDRWAKRERDPNKVAFGVMADDVAAGAQALLIVWLLQHFGWLDQFSAWLKGIVG